MMEEQQLLDLGDQLHAGDIAGARPAVDALAQLADGPPIPTDARSLASGCIGFAVADGRRVWLGDLELSIGVLGRLALGFAR
jgi:hypothetical protein